jgi:hypothetical protein
LKLYRVTLKGMTCGLGGDTLHGKPFVLAEDPQEAYLKVKKYLDDKDLGFSHERELHTIELLAETGDYPNCNIQLFL